MTETLCQSYAAVRARLTSLNASAYEEGVCGGCEVIMLNII